MKIVIPTEEGMLSEHFGKCETFTVFETNERGVFSESLYTAPVHQPGSIPRWIIEELGAELVISNSIGPKAIEILEASNVEVIQGVLIDEPKLIVEKFLKGSLKINEQSSCDLHNSEHNC